MLIIPLRVVVLQPKQTKYQSITKPCAMYKQFFTFLLFIL